MFVSYAQNFEDVILNRALKSVANGFYIDIGAQDPVTDSVSLAFYEMGWRGVHVEPTAVYAEKLRLARRDETVLEVAIGSRGGTVEFFESAATGLSTTQEAFARAGAAFGHAFVRKRVACLKTAALLDRFADREIHWLKIDVEGSEKSVIEGWAPSAVRPWIVVVESTVPMRPDPNHQEWEPTLLALGYEFVYFDGLNRFYVSERRPELKAAFGPGPNFFDGFVLNSSLHSPTGQRMLAQLAACEQALEAARAELAGRRTGKRGIAALPSLRGLARRIAFHANGRPRWAVRRAMFHKNGQARGAFRRIVFSARGRARPSFRRWLEAGSSQTVATGRLAHLPGPSHNVAAPLRKLAWAFAFHANGRPRSLLRLALFHRNGQERAAFRRIVFSKRGRARPSFRRWLEARPIPPIAGDPVAPCSNASPDNVTAALGVLEAARCAHRTTTVV